MDEGSWCKRIDNKLKKPYNTSTFAVAFCCIFKESSMNQALDPTVIVSGVILGDFYASFVCRAKQKLSLYFDA